MTLRLAASILTLGLAGCAHSTLQGSDLDQVKRPAFVSRTADEAGPRVTVYRSDSALASKLVGTNPADADHRLEESLKPAISPFEAAERLRSHVFAAIDTEKPWSQAVPPSQVAGALETFLVQEVPGTPPTTRASSRSGRTRSSSSSSRSSASAPRRASRRRGSAGAGGCSASRTEGSCGAAGSRATRPRPGCLPSIRRPSLATPVRSRSRWWRCSTRCRSRLARQLSPNATPPGTKELQTPADAQTPVEKEIDKSKAPAPPPDATAPTEVPVDSSQKKKAPKPSAPPPDATAPTEVPVDPKKK